MPTPRSLTYDYASNPDEVFALLRDPEFLKRRCEAAGESNVDIQISETGDGVRVITARDKAVDLPSFAKRMFQPQNRIVENTTWRRQGDRWVAEYAIEIKGIPGEVRGRSTLAPSPMGCRYETRFEVTARIPVVGGKLEGFVAERIEEQLRTNAERNDAQLKS
ncbi:MAG: DUF2505 domain-containing protein [Myxococcales bacterium]